MSEAVFTLVGVIVGGLVSAVSTFYLQRAAEDRRWKREDQVRYHFERVQLYTEFSKAANTIATLEMDNVQTPYEEPSYIKGNPRKLERQLFSVLYPQIAVIASTPVKEAADAFLEKVRFTAFEAMNSEIIDREEYAGALSMLAETFNQAAREELGIYSTKE